MPGQRPINIQDGFLFGNLKEGNEVAVALMTGKFFKGTIRRFDRFAVIFDTGDAEILVYKHALVSITEVPSTAARTNDRPLAVRRPPAGAPRRARAAQGW